MMSLKEWEAAHAIFQDALTFEPVQAASYAIDEENLPENDGTPSWNAMMDFLIMMDDHTGGVARRDNLTATIQLVAERQFRTAALVIAESLDGPATSDRIHPLVLNSDDWAMFVEDITALAQ